MVDELMSDEERGEALKRWFQENGAVLALGVALGIGALFGVRAWNDHQENRLETAAMQYQRVADALAREDAETVSQVATLLQDRYPSSPYATQARLAVARMHVEAGDLGAAAGVLREVMQATDDEHLEEVTRTRLARVLLSDGRPGEALELLSGVTPSPSFAALHYELYGDALRDLGRTEQARTAYNDALAALPQSGAPGGRNTLELKVVALGPAPSFTPPADAGAGAADGATPAGREATGGDATGGEADGAGGDADEAAGDAAGAGDDGGSEPLAPAASGDAGSGDAPADAGA